MNRFAKLNELLQVDPTDPGCEAGVPVLDEYVEVELAGGDPAKRFPRVATHLRTCPGCRADHDDLLEAVRTFPSSAPQSPRD